MVLWHTGSLQYESGEQSCTWTRLPPWGWCSGQAGWIAVSDGANFVHSGGSLHSSVLCPHSQSPLRTRLRLWAAIVKGVCACLPVLGRDNANTSVSAQQSCPSACRAAHQSVCTAVWGGTRRLWRGPWAAGLLSSLFPRGTPQLPSRLPRFPSGVSQLLAGTPRAQVQCLHCGFCRGLCRGRPVLTVPRV